MDKIGVVPVTTEQGGEMRDDEANGLRAGADSRLSVEFKKTGDDLDVKVNLGLKAYLKGVSLDSLLRMFWGPRNPL